MKCTKKSTRGAKKKKKKLAKARGFSPRTASLPSPLFTFSPRPILATNATALRKVKDLIPRTSFDRRKYSPRCGDERSRAPVIARADTEQRGQGAFPSSSLDSKPIGRICSIPPYLITRARSTLYFAGNHGDRLPRVGSSLLGKRYYAAAFSASAFFCHFVTTAFLGRFNV